MPRNSISKEINNATGWEARIDIICRRLRIPDMHSRSGLKKIHKNFAEVYGRLSTCYRENTKHHAVIGTVATVYAKMCTDALLRNQLFKEGFLSQIIPLLDISSCQILALKCLVGVTHHGGREARDAIARHAPKLVKVAQDNIDSDPRITEQCIVIVSHAAASVLNIEEVDPRLFKSLGSLESLLKLVDTVLRNPETTHNVFSHVLLLLTGAPQHARAAFIAHTPSISFLVACLRSTDLQTRVSGMVGILRLHLSVSEKDNRTSDPKKMIANLQRGAPQAMSDTLMRYGVERSEITLYMKSTAEFSRAMMQCAQDHDLYSLGMKIYELIGRTEYSVADGMFQDEHGETIDLGLPFVRWLDALPHCANAIRARGDPSQRDAANIVELKYLISRSRTADCHRLAEEALKSNPGIAFYYYARTLGAELADGLRWAKKGLKCKGPSLTPYVRFGLLYCAIEHAGLLGLQVLGDAHEGGRAWEEGFAIMRCGLEDSKTYVAEAPPDSRHMATAILWCTVLSIAVRGPDLSPDLSEIQPLLQKYEVAEEIKRFVHSVSTAKGQLRLARDTVLEYYTSATAEWGPIISSFDSKGSKTPSQALVLSRSADDELSAWLEDTNLEEGAEEEKLHCAHSGVNEKTLALYRCSNCSNPSASLKKRVRCGKARYCDVSCQKVHWSEHKKVCKAADTA